MRRLKRAVPMLTFALVFLVVPVHPAGPGGAVLAQDFPAWLRVASATYAIEVHGDTSGTDFVFPEIPMCAAGRCSDVFRESLTYALSFDVEVTSVGVLNPDTAKGTKITVTLVLVNTTDGSRETIGKLTRKLRDQEASRAKNFSIRGMAADEQLVATVTLKKGTIFAGLVTTVTVGLDLVE